MRKLKLLLVASMMTAGTALADNDLDVTIKVLESPHERPEAVTKTIQLPPSASQRAVQRSRRGLETANEARDRAHEMQNNIADEAKTKGDNKGNSGKGLLNNNRGRTGP